MAVPCCCQSSEGTMPSSCTCRATRGSVVAMLVLQVVVICCLPFVLPSRKSANGSSVGYPSRPAAFHPGSVTCKYGPCHECSDIDKMVHSEECDVTGFFQSVVCSNHSVSTASEGASTLKSKSSSVSSCSPAWRGPPASFLIFQMCWLVAGGVSLAVLRIRFRQLAEAAQRRIQQQLASVV